MSNNAEEATRENYAQDRLQISEIGPGAMGSLLVDHLSASPMKPLLMIGEPGIGKTAVTTQLEETGKYHILSIRLVNEDEGTMIGYAAPDDNGMTVTLRVVKKVKEAADAAKEAGKRLIIFFDEVNRAKEHMVKYVFNIMDTRRWGDFELPVDTSFIAAINPPTKNHKVKDILSDSALRRRFRIAACKAEASEYLSYAAKVEIHPAVIGFIKSKPSRIYDYTSLDNNLPYACPATWDAVSDVMKWYEAEGGKLSSLSKNINMNRMLTGDIGQAMTHDFITYAEDMSKRFAPQNLLSNYKTVRKEIQDTINSEFTEEDADLDLSKISAIVTTLSTYVADQIVNSGIHFHADEDSIQENKWTKKEATQYNKYGKNLSTFLSDCPSELFQTFMHTVTKEIEVIVGSNSPKAHDFTCVINELSKYDAYCKAALKFMEVRNQ